VGPGSRGEREGPAQAAGAGRQTGGEAGDETEGWPVKRYAILLGLTWLAITGASPAPLVPPPPDLTRLVPFAAAPLDKPALVIPDVAMPSPPADVPTVPAAALVLPAAERPTAPLPAPRTLPCIGSFLRVASESLECGRSKFGKGEYDEAARAFESAVRTSSDRDITTEARYWLGETLVRLGRVEQADFVFRQAAGERPSMEHEIWAMHGGAWTALHVGDAARGRDAFARLTASAVPAPMAPWARHGLGLALYALGQYAEAERVWTDLERRGVPAPLARDVQFWQGETRGRLGDHARAEADLKRFIGGGAHPLLETGMLRLGWWTLAAGRPAESVPVFKSYLAAPGAGRARGERAWGDAGLAIALASTGEWEGATKTVRGLAAAKSPLAMPAGLSVVRRALEAKKADAADAIVQDLLAGQITPGVRSWLLLLKGDAHRVAGNRDEARTQYDLAQKSQPGGELAPYALFRLAQTNFEMREFGQAATDAATVLRGTLPADLRAAAMLLQAEAAYRANDFKQAHATLRRILVELPQHPEISAARLSLAWVALSERRPDEARQLFTEFARRHADHPAAADALLIASELALRSGDFDAGRRDLDRLIGGFPMHPRTEFARLNRGILAVREGHTAEAQPLLRDWIGRAPFPPLVGRARLAFGAALLAANATGEAMRQFTAVQSEGSDPIATLGLGGVALLHGKLNEASRLFTDARDAGTTEVAAAAEYGLAAVAAQKGQIASFKAPALAALKATPPPSPESVTRLLYVLTGIAVEEKEWPAALDYAKRLVTEFPRAENGDDALERVGAGAAAAANWPIVYETYTLMQARYPTSPFIAGSRVALAEAQLATGRAAEARQVLEPLALVDQSDTRVWVALAKAREATGDKRGALEAYGRAARDAKGGGANFTRDAFLGEARMLTAERRWDQARVILDRLLKTADAPTAVEAAYWIGETWREEGDPLAASEYYLTAAYLAPDSAFGRKAMLATGQSLAAAKQPEAAANAFRKLLSQSDLPADLADAARQGLQTLGVR
jgi:tetratricopeptide (TPR) repeat protein